jgi:hypothetical protein
MPPVALPPKAPKLSKGDRIRVTQLLLGRDLRWATTVEGVVESFRAEPTGSWYAHGKGAKLWLLRVRLRKDDGEITALTLDAHSRIEILSPQRHTPQ